MSSDAEAKLLWSCLPSCGTSECSTLRQRCLPSLRSSATTTKSRAVGSFSPGTAVETSTMSPRTIGLPRPSPGTSTFQRTFLASDHSSGGSAVGLSPVRSGPRHSGQSAARERSGVRGHEGEYEGGERENGGDAATGHETSVLGAFRPFYLNRDAGKSDGPASAPG